MKDTVLGLPKSSKPRGKLSKYVAAPKQCDARLLQGLRREQPAMCRGAQTHRTPWLDME